MEDCQLNDVCRIIGCQDVLQEGSWGGKEGHVLPANQFRLVGNAQHTAFSTQSQPVMSYNLQPPVKSYMSAAGVLRPIKPEAEAP
jgi:hypothetical protein